MKKIIAFLAVFVMITGTAFAQFAFQGMVAARADLATNSAHINVGHEGFPLLVDDGARRRWHQEARLFVMAMDSDQTFGANIRMWFPSAAWDGHDSPYWTNGSEHFHGWVWWRPMPNLRITVGEDAWGRYGLGHIIGWGFNANHAEDWLLGWGSAGAAHYGTGFHRTEPFAAWGGGHDRLNRNTGFYHGFQAPGISATFRPIPALELLLAVPFGIDHSGRVERPGYDISIRDGWVAGLLRSHVGARFAIPDMGTLALTFVGGPGYWGERASHGPTGPMYMGPTAAGGASMDERANFTNHFNSNGTNSSRFHLSFFMPGVIPGLNLNIGAVYTLPFNVTRGNQHTYHYPVEFGLGVQYTSGDFAIRLRAATTAFGFIDHGTGDNTDFAPVTGVGIAPSFNLGFMSLHMNAGVHIAWTHSTSNMAGVRSGGNFGSEGWDGALGWHVTPYLVVPITNAHVYAGFHAETNGVRQAQGATSFRDNAARIHWRIPVGLRFEL